MRNLRTFHGGMLEGSVVGAIVGGSAAKKAAKKQARAANRATAQAAEAAKLQFETSQRQLDLAEKASEKSFEFADKQFGFSKDQFEFGKQQWQTYVDKILPLEMEAQQLGIDAQELAQQRGEADFALWNDFYRPLSEGFVKDAEEGIEAQPERAARDARIETDKAFDQAEGQYRRNLERRGVRPGSGGYSDMGDTSLARAATKSFAVNRAIEAERDRVEDVNFNRKAVAVGRQPLGFNPTQAPGRPGVTPNSINQSYGGASAGLSRAGANLTRGVGAFNAPIQNFGAAGQSSLNVGSVYGNSAANTINSGIQLGAQLGKGVSDFYSKYVKPSGSNFFSNIGGFFKGPQKLGGGGGGGWSNDPFAFNHGGMVHAPNLGRQAYNYGGMVRGYADGGEVNGPPGIDQVPAEIVSPDGSRVPARLTDGEYVIPADVVRAVGTDPLDKIIERARANKEQSRRGPNALTRPGRY